MGQFTHHTTYLHGSHMLSTGYPFQYSANFITKLVECIYICRGYYKAVWRYEFYFWVVRTIVYERAQRVSKILLLCVCYKNSANFIVNCCSLVTGISWSFLLLSSFVRRSLNNLKSNKDFFFVSTFSCSSEED